MELVVIGCLDLPHIAYLDALIRRGLFVHFLRRCWLDIWLSRIYHLSILGLPVHLTLLRFFSMLRSCLDRLNQKLGLAKILKRILGWVWRISRLRSRSGRRQRDKVVKGSPKVVTVVV